MVRWGAAVLVLIVLWVGLPALLRGIRDGFNDKMRP